MQWFKDGLRFECKNCGKCCGTEPGFIFVTEDEVLNIKAITGLEEADFIRETKYGKSIREMDNYDCIFLKKCKCKIYDNRPEQCKRFPFWDIFLNSPDDWNSVAKFCIGVNKGRSFTEEEILNRMFRVKEFCGG